MTYGLLILAILALGVLNVAMWIAAFLMRRGTRRFKRPFCEHEGSEY